MRRVSGQRRVGKVKSVVRPIREREQDRDELFEARKERIRKKLARKRKLERSKKRDSGSVSLVERKRKINRKKLNEKRLQRRKPENSRFSEKRKRVITLAEDVSMPISGKIEIVRAGTKIKINN